MKCGTKLTLFEYFRCIHITRLQKSTRACCISRLKVTLLQPLEDVKVTCTIQKATCKSQLLQLYEKKFYKPWYKPVISIFPWLLHTFKLDFALEFAQFTFALQPVHVQRHTATPSSKLDVACVSPSPQKIVKGKKPTWRSHVTVF